MNAIRHTILGLFFFATLAALGFVTIYLGDVTSSPDRTTLGAWFETVEGLGVGDPVMVAGVQIGRVTAVRPAEGDAPPEKQVKVVFVIDHKLELHEDYVVAIGSTNLLGGKQLDVAAGVGAPLPRDRWGDLKGVADANLMRHLAGILEENRADVRRILTAAAHLAEDVDSGRRTIADLLLPKATNDDIAQAVRAGRDLLAKLEHGDGSFAKLVNSPAVHDALESFLERGNTLLADARDKPGVLHAAIYDEQLAADLKRGVEGFASSGERLGRGEGLLGRLTTSESDPTFRQLAQLAADGSSLVADVRAGKGAIGRLFSDPAVEQQVVDIVGRLSGITADAGALLDAARRGRGVLGLLVADDEARRNVERIIDSIARAVEDAREAAPVSSVASFLFGQL